MRSTFDVPLVGSWGLTEFPNATSAAPDDSMEIVTTSVGRPATDVSVRATDANGDVCGTAEEGELVLRGPQCFSGYVDATLNDSSIDADGWFHTGDLGIIDAAGNVRITGRLKDIIIRNAENISVLEVEDLLYRHPDVADAAVVGIADQRTGERVVAFVVLRDGSGVDLTNIREHCRLQACAVQKCPEQLEVVEAIPRNGIGEVPQAGSPRTPGVARLIFFFFFFFFFLKNPGVSIPLRFCWAKSLLPFAQGPSGRAQLEKDVPETQSLMGLKAPRHPRGPQRRLHTRRRMCHDDLRQFLSCRLELVGSDNLGDQPCLSGRVSRHALMECPRDSYAPGLRTPSGSSGGWARTPPSWRT